MKQNDVARIVIEIDRKKHSDLTQTVAANGHTIKWVITKFVDQYLEENKGAKSVKTPARTTRRNSASERTTGLGL